MFQKLLHLIFQFETQLSQDTNELDPLQRSHGLRPYVQSARPCALNTARFATVPGSKRNPCERWQGAKLIGV